MKGQIFLKSDICRNPSIHEFFQMSLWFVSLLPNILDWWTGSWESHRALQGHREDKWRMAEYYDLMQLALYRLLPWHLIESYQRRISVQMRFKVKHANAGRGSFWIELGSGGIQDVQQLQILTSLNYRVERGKRQGHLYFATSQKPNRRHQERIECYQITVTVPRSIFQSDRCFSFPNLSWDWLQLYFQISFHCTFGILDHCRWQRRNFSEILFDYWVCHLYL